MKQRQTVLGVVILLVGLSTTAYAQLPTTDVAVLAEMIPVNSNIALQLKEMIDMKLNQLAQMDFEISQGRNLLDLGIQINVVMPGTTNPTAAGYGNQAIAQLPTENPQGQENLMRGVMTVPMDPNEVQQRYANLGVQDQDYLARVAADNQLLNNQYAMIKARNDMLATYDDKLQGQLAWQKNMVDSLIQLQALGKDATTAQWENYAVWQDILRTEQASLTNQMLIALLMTQGWQHVEAGVSGAAQAEYERLAQEETQKARDDDILANPDWHSGVKEGYDPFAGEEDGGV